MSKAHGKASSKTWKNASEDTLLTFYALDCVFFILFRSFVCLMVEIFVSDNKPPDNIMQGNLLMFYASYVAS